MPQVWAVLLYEYLYEYLFQPMHELWVAALWKMNLGAGYE
jgi:hypothetical protein